MPEHLLKIKIMQPGRATGCYRPETHDSLYLEKVVYPEQELPFDVAILPTALTVFGEPYLVLVIGGISQPANTVLEARLIGGLQRDDSSFLLAAPTADERIVLADLDQVPSVLRDEVYRTVQEIRPGNWNWTTIAELEPILHNGSLRYRKAAEASGRTEYEPDWKPRQLKRLNSGFSEADMYTAAEYTFQELPYHFQHYVSEHLAPDERILYAVRRPAILSYKKHRWRRVRLQAGVLILSTQRLIQLAELMPPDSSNIRYGFHSIVGVLERFSGADLEKMNGDTLALRTRWLAAGGQATIEWEAPLSSQAALAELMTFLQAFQVEADDCMLRRASQVPVPDTLPPLADLSATDSVGMGQLNERFFDLLGRSLAPHEEPRAWALLPEWLDRKKSAKALVVTPGRTYLLPDAEFDVPLRQIATVEFTSSILKSALVVNYFDRGTKNSRRIDFPYPAQAAFRDCFEGIRRGMAVVPLVERSEKLKAWAS